MPDPGNRTMILCAILTVIFGGVATLSWMGKLFAPHMPRRIPLRSKRCPISAPPSFPPNRTFVRAVPVLKLNGLRGFREAGEKQRRGFRPSGQGSGAGVEVEIPSAGCRARPRRQP
ncbi:hypothetical protein VQ056_21650 [Paenibacillus sp. JTLBN-2024]